MDCQSLALPVPLPSVHWAPGSEDVQMFPPATTAATLVPSEEDVMEYQTLALPTLLSSVQVEASAGTNTHENAHKIMRVWETITHFLLTGETKTRECLLTYGCKMLEPKWLRINHSVHATS